MAGMLAVAQVAVEAFKHFKLPETRTHTKSFLGLCNVYRRFVINFAPKAPALNVLVKKGQPAKLLSLTKDQIGAYNNLKEALIKPPILSLPSLNLP